MSVLQSEHLDEPLPHKQRNGYNVRCL